MLNEQLIIIEQSTILGKQFNVYGDVENPLFLAKDVATWIEYSETNISNMLEMVDQNEKLKLRNIISGQNRESWFITEDGLYELLMRSNVPIAKQFKTEVKKLLKDLRLKRISIHQTPTSYIEALKQLIQSEEEKQRIQLERDEAIRLKAMVAAGREGTLFSQTGVLTKQLNSALNIIDDLELENRKLKSNFSLTISGFTIKHKIKLSKTEKQQYGKELSKCCRDKNLEIHTHIFPGEKYPSNIYPEHILIEFFLRQGYDLNL